MSQEPQYGRRRFLKDSLVSIAKTAQEYVAHRDAQTEKSGPAPRGDWLRPPGALDERTFSEQCTKCGDCVKACPYGAILEHPKDGFPIIFADRVPCYLCDDFPCIAACEADALVPVVSRDAVRMGTAEVSRRLCTADQGCNACIAQCPTGALAMDFVALGVRIEPERCVGCGICEYTCKSVNDQAAIAVRPARSVPTDGATLS